MAVKGVTYPGQTTNPIADSAPAPVTKPGSVVSPIVRPAPTAAPAPAPTAGAPAINVASVGGSMLGNLQQGAAKVAGETGGMLGSGYVRPILGPGQLEQPHPSVDPANPFGFQGGARSAGSPAAAPAAAPASSSALPYGNVSTFGAGGDLRNKQILPGQGADRFAIAQGRYNDFLKDSAPGDFDAIRGVRQAEAGAGRLGSGMAVKGFADLGARIEQARGSARDRFLQDALEGTIGDQANQRDEYRRERGYESDTAQNSLNNRRQQTMDEDTLTNSAFDRDYRHTGQVADIGFRGNPSGDLLDASRQEQGVANQSGDDLAELMRQYAYGQSTTPPAGAQWPEPAGTIPQTTQYPPYKPPPMQLRGGY